MKILFLILLLSITGCAHYRPDKWDTLEIAGAATLTALMVVDYSQTSMISRNPDKWHEMNPIIGDPPSQGTVNTYFPISWAVKLIVAHFLPHPWRKAWLAIWIGESAVLVQNNERIGLRP